MVRKYAGRLDTPANGPFTFDVATPEEPKTGLILVHGFGVRRDSRGMFTDIEDALSDRMLVIRADFSVDGGALTMALPLSNQVQRLHAVERWVRSQHPEIELSYVGHSQGCLVVAKASPTGAKVILLAPPVEDVAVKFANTSGWKREGSHLDQLGVSQLVRSDGSITKVGAEYWQELMSIDASKLYRVVNGNNDVMMLFAYGDQVLGRETPPFGIPWEWIDEADHDFSGSPDFNGSPRLALLKRLATLV